MHAVNLVNAGVLRSLYMHSKRFYLRLTLKEHLLEIRQKSHNQTPLQITRLTEISLRIMPVQIT